MAVTVPVSLFLGFLAFLATINGISALKIEVLTTAPGGGATIVTSAGFIASIVVGVGVLGAALKFIWAGMKRLVFGT